MERRSVPEICASRFSTSSARPSKKIGVAACRTHVDERAAPRSPVAWSVAEASVHGPGIQRPSWSISASGRHRQGPNSGAARPDRPASTRRRRSFGREGVDGRVANVATKR